jgi:hypothetical protein
VRKGKVWLLVVAHALRVEVEAVQGDDRLRRHCVAPRRVQQTDRG